MIYLSFFIVVVISFVFVLLLCAILNYRIVHRFHTWISSIAWYLKYEKILIMFILIKSFTYILTSFSHSLSNWSLVALELLHKIFIMFKDKFNVSTNKSELLVAFVWHFCIFIIFYITKVISFFTWFATNALEKIQTIKHWFNVSDFAFMTFLFLNKYRRVSLAYIWKFKE